LHNRSPNERPEFLSGQFQGDIVLTKEQIEDLNDVTDRTGLIDKRYNWPNAVVYIQISPNTFSEFLKMIFFLNIL
jgi:hypothetical protein